jgi:hypothetical protein
MDSDAEGLGKRRENAAATVAEFSRRTGELEKKLGSVVAGDSVHSELDSLVQASRELSANLHDAAQELSTYDLQQQMAALKGLDEKIAQRREELAPRAKFSFKRKSKPAQAASAPKESAPAASASNREVSAVPLDALLIEAKTKEKIVLKPGGKDVMLKDLSDCEVHLLDVVGALRVQNLQRCIIWAPAVATSCLLYNCTESVFVFVAQQLRLHDSDRLALYLHTKSSPIIEGCKRIAFGPYPPDALYDDSEATWAIIGLKPNNDDSTWADVQDFHWHKTTHSPNWKLADLAQAEAVFDLRCLDLLHDSDEC